MTVIHMSDLTERIADLAKRLSDDPGMQTIEIARLAKVAAGEAPPPSSTADKLSKTDKTEVDRLAAIAADLTRTKDGKPTAAKTTTQSTEAGGSDASEIARLAALAKEAR